jgi:predicted DNA-binding protein (UPF0251 family)
MGRPFKARRVAFDTLKLAREKKLYEAPEPLGLDEVEALRLHFVTQYRQEDAATEMCISRSTYSRLLMRAGDKVTRALLRGELPQVRDI